MQVARLEVEGRVAVEEGPHPVQREPRLGQRPGLGRAQPAAVRERCTGADPVALDDGHVVSLAAQVVGAAEAGDAASDDDDAAAHGPEPGSPAVTWSSIRMSGTANCVTTVVRAGRGGANRSDQIRFQAGKSEPSARNASIRITCSQPAPACSSTAPLSRSTI